MEHGIGHRFDDVVAEEPHKKREKRFSLADLPSWVKPGEACRWWSVRDDSWMSAVIHGLDEDQGIVEFALTESDEICATSS
ncbi:MAG: hypothetical protein ACKPKO_56405, partial [Candidatus Fonsibacter sp.]